MSISSLNNLQLNRLRGLNVGSGLFEKMNHLLLNQLSTKQTQRPRCKACSVRKMKKYTISLTNFQLDRLRGPKGRVLLVTISIYSLTNFQSNRLRGPRADVPNVGQGRVLLEKYVPLLLIKLTYLHIQIRHVHLHFRNNIVLLMSFCLRNWTTLLSE